MFEQGCSTREMWEAFRDSADVQFKTKNIRWETIFSDRFTLSINYILWSGLKQVKSITKYVRSYLEFVQGLLRSVFFSFSSFASAFPIWTNVEHVKFRNDCELLPLWWWVAYPNHFLPPTEFPIVFVGRLSPASQRIRVAYGPSLGSRQMFNSFCTLSSGLSLNWH